jgi:leucyl/phenylalanyl-tRNA---protein transferase
MLTVEELLSAYSKGFFPMADNRAGDELHWYSPVRRGVLPLDERFHVPRSLQKFLKTCPYEVRFNAAFGDVIRACADVRSEKRRDTWINDTIIALYEEMARRGNAHSVESWYGGKLVGGLYGVSIGGAFFGESMFSLIPHASKVALVHLVRRLQSAGYQLLDTQYVNDHLRQFGVLEIPRASYLESLEKALNASPNPSTRFLTASDIKS